MGFEFVFIAAIGLGGWCNILRPAFFPLGFRLISTNNNDFIKKQEKHIKHTHCLYLAKAIRGRQCGYSTYLKIFNKEN